jgi:hypothetical protein
MVSIYTATRNPINVGVKVEKAKTDKLVEQRLTITVPPP